MTYIKIPYNQITVNLRALAPATLPAFLGSTIRGSLGMALKKLLCKRELLDDCRKCTVYELCLYTRLFTNQVKSKSIDGHEYLKSLPNPFVIKVPPSGKEIYKEGDILSFDMVLAGKAKNYLMFLFEAFAVMAENGLGARRIPFALESVCDSATGNVVYTPKNARQEYLTALEWNSHPVKNCKELEVIIDTPLRLKTEGRISRGISFELLMLSIVRRLESISSIYCGEETSAGIDPDRITGILVKKAAVKTARFNRYSNKASQQQEVCGLIGSITFIGSLSEYLPYFEGGEIFHAGKFATMGMGRYHIIAR